MTSVAEYGGYGYSRTRVAPILRGSRQMFIVRLLSVSCTVFSCTYLMW